MPLFRKPSTAPSGSSSVSVVSRSPSGTSKPEPGTPTKNVKPADLPFARNPASPNSRILSLPLPDCSSSLHPSVSISSPASVRLASIPAPWASGSSSDSDSASVETASGRGSVVNGGVGGKGGVTALPRSDSPVDVSSEEAETTVEEETDEEEGRGKLNGSGNGKVQEKPSRPVSRAARLAAEAMETPVQLPERKGKPLTSLTYEDVKMTEDEMRGDIKIIWTAMHLFMNSRMVEAEEICMAGADSRLYYSLGYALIQTIKSLATFEPEDLEAAINCCKDSIVITQLLRKSDLGLVERSIRLAKGSASVHSIKQMTVVQRHAELVFAECTLLKAVLGIIYSGDFLAFLKEALNMRNAYAIYRVLAKYVQGVDDEFGAEDPSLDEDFRSGVHLGNGLISVILSLLPSAVLTIMHVFGFTGDCAVGLATLMKPGRWVVGNPVPGVDPAKEGLRRPICDMVLCVHHLVTASYLPVGGVDVPTAANVLNYNLDRYPNGVFFLYFSGRLYFTQTQLELAVTAFRRALNAQREYIQLGHICYWDMGLVFLAHGNHQKGFECFNILAKESNWSKAIYAYAKAATLYEQNGDDKSQENEIMKSVPDLMQRIAGKSIPLEKFVARRARKFISQGNRLCLPAIELAYVLNCLGQSPRFILFEVHLDQVSTVIAELHETTDPLTYGGGDEYWDDYCLAHLLRGVILSFLAHPKPYVVARPAESPIPIQEADEQALISFNNVLKHANDLTLDHHLVWFAHYELGRLYESKEEWGKAKDQYDIVLSGRMEGGKGKGKGGKVSLQNQAILRSNSALQTMRDQGRI